MIKVKLYTQEEWLERRNEATDWEYYFDWVLLDPTFEENEKPPFRDAESLRLLKETYDITFVSKEDWYSVMYEGTRLCVSCINKSLKFALAAIDCSRGGGYTWYGSANQKICQILSDLPVDILVAVRASDLADGLFLDGAEYELSGYPYNGQRIQVTVKNVIRGEGDFYTKVPEHREYGTGYGLYIGKDGKYYSDRFGISVAFRYYWKKDIPGILRYLDYKNQEKPRSLKPGTYDIFELGRILDQDENCIMFLDYLNRKGCIESQYQCGKVNRETYEKVLASMKEGEDYEEYLYFQNQFRVINHCTMIPDGILHRKLPVMMVDQNDDGTYLIHNSLTVKYPSFDELFYDVIQERSADRKRFVLIVDVEEHLSGAEDLDRAVCGFRVLADSVEVFPAEDALQIFGDWLKEAYDSKHCTISGGFC